MIYRTGRSATQHISRFKRGQGSRLFFFFFLFLFTSLHVFADDKVYPDKPNPPALVNDFAHMLSPQQTAQLEAKLDNFSNTTSTQITIVTIKNLGGHDVEEYSVEVFNRWGLGQAGKNNGVLLLASLDDHKAWITVGKGLEGVLTDDKSGLIFRNEIVPAFKEKRYYDGLNDASGAIIAVTKGEYTSDGIHGQENHHIPFTVVILAIIFIFFIIRMFGRGGGGGNGGGGIGNFATGMLLGNMLGGGFGRGGDNDGGGFGGGGGGGFGGFGGGSTGGGGAGGSW